MVAQAEPVAPQQLVLQATVAMVAQAATVVQEVLVLMALVHMVQLQV